MLLATMLTIGGMVWGGCIKDSNGNMVSPTMVNAEESVPILKHYVVSSINLELNNWYTNHY